MKIQFKGVLEIDQNRGVIYFHNQKTGTTLLRISKLPSIPDVDNNSFLDISNCQHCSWNPKPTVGTPVQSTSPLSTHGNEVKE